ncbi:MAG: RND family transporter [Deltaproteobacteria bacterium]|nr:RND family transporter [Deltaproteobacteria bacterium]
MTKPRSLTIRFFDNVILAWPGPVLLCLFIIVSYIGYHSKDFRLDASAETLVLEGDRDLKYSRLIYSRYGVNDFLVVTYAPKNDLFSDKTMTDLAQLQDDFARIKGVSSVVSILNVPLLESPPVPVKELASHIQTLESPAVDKKLARMEFYNSPLYRNLLVSPDLKTTALLLYLPIDKVYEDLLTRRNRFREKQTANALSKTEAAEFKKVRGQFQRYRDKMRENRHETILAVRAVMDEYRQDAQLFLGGVSMVADDLIGFIKSDLKLFGIGVFCFLIITLGIIFRKLRWILLPMLCCALSTLSMIGLLGLFGWEVTVISSNFVSLQLIITMAITIHLIVRYRELLSNNPGDENRTLILNTIRLKLRPCLYAALTTIAGFGSLIFCNIKPVITFGWMMTAGIIVSLILTFLLFPAALILLKKQTPQPARSSNFSFLSLLAKFTETHGVFILAVSFIILILSAVGVSRLEVENSFIGYFKESTEIYQGMKVIDQNLGGTTPLDVIIDLEEPKEESPKVAIETRGENNDEFDEFEEFEDVDDDKKYWFTSKKMARTLKIHDYLDSLKETGKVLSLGTIVKIAEKLNNGKPLDNFQMALLYNEMPEQYKNMILKPYVSVEDNQLRFSVRVKDSEKSLRRNTLLKKIRHELVNKLGLKKEHVHLAGMLVLYNNMLQSLFGSQILTIGVVFIALMGMFLILFRSLGIALIAILPNMLSVGVVLGTMGWLNIPLDMMTITIAAISVGIAVDDTIHYIHRFKEEFQVDRNYINTVHRCHGSIGYAMYYTSVTIIIGFSILTLSNFIPSIYFGLLTGLAMFIALIAALTLLPQLLIVFKPFGLEGRGNV